MRRPERPRAPSSRTTPWACRPNFKHAVDPAPLRLASTAFGFRASRALLAALDVGLFTELARGPRSAAQLTHRLGLSPTALPDLLDALVALGLLSREGEGERALYLNTRESDLHLDRRQAGYLGDWLRQMTHAEGEDWTGWTQAISLASPPPGVDDAPDRRPTVPAHPMPKALHIALSTLPVWDTHRRVLHLGDDGAQALRSLAPRHAALDLRSSMAEHAKGAAFSSIDLLVIDLPWVTGTPSLAATLRRAARELPAGGAVLLLEHVEAVPGPWRPDADVLLARLARQAIETASADGTPTSTIPTSATAPDHRAARAIDPVAACLRAGLQAPRPLLHVGSGTAWYAMR